MQRNTRLTICGPRQKGQQAKHLTNEGRSVGPVLGGGSCSKTEQEIENSKVEAEGKVMDGGDIPSECRSKQAVCSLVATMQELRGVTVYARLVLCTASSVSVDPSAAEGRADQQHTV
jgi:hypothetical protein